MFPLKKLTAALLVLALTLTGCAVDRPPEVEEPEELPPETPVADVVTPETYSKADNVFSINYVRSASLNPLKGTNIYNDQLFGLVYESLFELTSDLRFKPVLCEDWSTEDGIHYLMSVKEGVRFHDGTLMTAEDVIYSINEARNSPKYSSRLDMISYAGVGEDGRLDIRLKRSDYQFPAVLDVPIIKSGTGEEETPPGTGPYRLMGSYLAAFASYREELDSVPKTIYLKEISSAMLAESFSERDIDLLGFDPVGGLNLNIHLVHETRYYDTTDLLYLGFNCSGRVVNDILVRRALLRIINRDAIVSDIFGSAARRSTFILNPALGYYDDSAQGGYNYSRTDFQRLCLVAGLEDTDLDGYLEYSAAPFTLRFIVNTESEAKLSAARRIATDMQNMGVNVTLDELTYDQYEAALKSGNFAMYMGEVQLKADFDLTALFSGSLNFGKITDTEYQRLNDEYLSATEDTRQQAAEALNMYVAEDTAIVPILYKQRLVLTHLGVVSGAEPSQSNIFSGFASWRVDLKGGAG